LYIFSPKHTCPSCLKTIRSHNLICKECSKIIVKVVVSKVETGSYEFSGNSDINDMARMAYNEYNVKRR
jgi:hypothetical protein